MGTTKDPEGFRRHTAGRGDVLGIKGGGPKRRGCGLGLGLGVVLAAGLIGAATWALRGEPERSNPASANPAAVEHGAIEELVEFTEPEVERAAAIEDLGTVAGEGPRTAAQMDPFAPAAGAPSIVPGKLSTIRLLRAWSDAPLAHAEVFWLGDAERRRHDEWAGLVDIHGDPEAVLRRLGRHGTSDADGRLGIDSDGGHLLVLGDGWMRALDLRPYRTLRAEVRVFPQRTLAVDVTDWSGAPARGLNVHIWRVDAQGEPRLSLKSLTTSPESGTIRYEDIDTVLQPMLERDPRTEYDRHAKQRHPGMPALERTRLRVALDTELAPAVWAEIDLAQELLPHLRLQLPPLGRLRILVADEQGRAVPWPGKVQLRSVGKELVAPKERGLVEGRAVFEHLRFGEAFLAQAIRSDGAKGPEYEVHPLTEAEPEREVVLPDVAPQPRIVLRALHPSGSALPRTWVEVWIHSRRPPTEGERSDALGEEAYERALLDGFVLRGGIQVVPEQVEEMHIYPSHRRALRTDASGYIELPMPAQYNELTQLTVSVSLRLDGGTLVSAHRRVESGPAWTDLDLGNFQLFAPVPENLPSR